MFIKNFQPLRKRLPRSDDKRYNLYSLFCAYGYREVYGSYGLSFNTFLLLACVDLITSNGHLATLKALNGVFPYHYNTTRKKINYLVENSYLTEERLYKPNQNGGMKARCFSLSHLGVQVINTFNRKIDNSIDTLGYKS